jgi:hypothetical protein
MNQTKRNVHAWPGNQMNQSTVIIENDTLTPAPRHLTLFNRRSLARPQVKMKFFKFEARAASRIGRFEPWCTIFAHPSNRVVSHYSGHEQRFLLTRTFMAD